MTRGLVLIIMITIMSPSTMSNLPPEAPWGISYRLSDMQWVWWSWHVNMTISLTVPVNWVMLWLNMTAIAGMLGLDNETSRNMTILVNGQPLVVNATGWYNMSFSQVLDMTREYHGENITARWHVVVRHVMPQQSHEAPPPGGEPAWVKYWWAILASLVTIVAGIPAGMSLKEARLKDKWKKLLASKAMDVGQVLKALEGEGHGEDMG